MPEAARNHCQEKKTAEISRRREATRKKTDDNLAERGLIARRITEAARKYLAMTFYTV